MNITVDKMLLRGGSSRERRESRERGGRVMHFFDASVVPETVGTSTGPSGRREARYDEPVRLTAMQIREAE